MPWLARRRYSTKPSPSRSPKESIQSRARARRALQLEDDPVVAGPAPQLREQDEEQRRRVDRAVVAVGPDERGLPSTQLVHDLPGLRVALGIVGVRLRTCERAQRAGGRLGTEEQFLERRDERVAAEQRHEPRQPCRRNHAAPGPAQPECGQVRERLRPRALERGFGRCAQPRRRAPPGSERRVPVASIVAKPSLERGSVELRCPRSEATARRRRGCQRSPGASRSLYRAAPPSTSSGAGSRCTSVRAGKPWSTNSTVRASCQRSGRDGATSDDARRAEVLHALDREDVGEVGCELQLEHRLHLAVGPVPDSCRLFEAATDEELAPHRQPGLPLQVEDRRRAARSARRQPGCHGRRRSSAPSATESAYPRRRSRTPRKRRRHRRAGRRRRRSTRREA